MSTVTAILAIAVRTIRFVSGLIATSDYCKLDHQELAVQPAMVVQAAANLGPIDPGKVNLASLLSTLSLHAHPPGLAFAHPVHCFAT